MRDKIVSPYFSEDSYKGQDVVHQGIRIPLTIPAEVALEKFSRNAQRIIKDDWHRLTYETVKPEYLAELRSMWFDPNDKTFPQDLSEHIGIVAYEILLNGDGQTGTEFKMRGGILLKKEGANLFIHQLIASEEGKKMQAPTLLVWEAVRRYSGQYHAIDVGVSYNPKRYKFFKNFEVETYPIILKKPFYVPVIRLSPFRGFDDLAPDQDGENMDEDFKKANITFLPRGNYALYAALRHIGVGKGDVVSIVKTFPGHFITGCVTKTIEKTEAHWLRNEIVPNTRALVVIHEFGIPVNDPEYLTIIDQARDLNIPVIEDCAWRTSPVFPWSNYKVFSLQKMVNMNYGGLLHGVHIEDDVLWGWGVLDTVKRKRLGMECLKDPGAIVRARNWHTYHKFVIADGMTPDDSFDYEEAVMKGSWMPTVYMQKFETDTIAGEIMQRLEEFGIQAGRYWGDNVVYLPIHQNQSVAEVEYMFAVVKGYFNSCRDFK